MALNDTGRDIALDALTGDISHLGLHTAFPATSGNEITGGAPAYARKAVTWAAKTGTGTRTAAINETPTFDVPAATVAAHGCWDALTVGNIDGSADCTDEVFGAQGQYQITAFSISVT